MKLALPKLLAFGVALEVLIFIGCYMMHPEIEETFRCAARYSGRLSAVVFLASLYNYAMEFPKPLNGNIELRNLIVLFVVLHIIHFGFLATNVYLNDIPIVPVKLTGGALAYLMIVLAPFVIHRSRRIWQLVYFYYVTAVMIVTYLSRAKDDFEGGDPFWFHYLALVVFIAAAVGFGARMWKVNRASSK